MIAVFRTCVFGCYEPFADLTGEAVAARVCFIVTLFKCFPFIFTVHNKFLLKMFNVFSGGTVSVDLPNLPVSPHSPKINYTFSKNTPLNFYLYITALKQQYYLIGLRIYSVKSFPCPSPTSAVLEAPRWFRRRNVCE